MAGRWKGEAWGGKGTGSLNLSGGNTGPPGIICGCTCDMLGGGRNGGRWGLGTAGGMAGLGPCMMAGCGRCVITGDPSCLSPPASAGVPRSPSASPGASSGGFTLPVVIKNEI